MKNLNKIHPNFTLNGNSFDSVENLLIYSKKNAVDSYTFLTHWFSSSLAVSVKTSGSTGKPKVVELKKAHMINSALATGSFFNLKANTTALLCLSLNNIAGKMMLVRALVLGWHIDVITPSNNPLDGIKKNYDFCAMVPLQVQNSIQQLHQIKKLIVGGAPLNENIIAQLQGLKTKVFATFGMTETITHIAVKEFNNSKSRYTTLPNISILKDERGCLIINAPKISDSQIITNDLVNIIDSSHFDWLGRFDRVINSGGIKIIPEVVESKLSELLPFRFFITGLPDNKLGEKVVLICEGIFQEINNQQIKKILLKYECPKQILFISRFIETQTKKINRKKTLKLLLV